MREIKFRAWDKDKKQWLRVDTVACIVLYGNGEIGFDTGYGVIPINSNYAGLQNIELMQYTGLHDKNGKEIYEGDILKEPNTIFGDFLSVVEWGKLEICLGWTDTPEMVGWMQKPLNKKYDSYPLYIYWDTEIIGNIYENPELLRDKDV